MLAPRITWTVHTEVFDGPLDLLLYLVKRDGIDLRKVSIAGVAGSYMEFIDRMVELHISVASDYLVMGATLCYLKSLELLPRQPTILEEDEVDPREALVRRLEAYEQIKEAAEKFAALPRVDRDVFIREPMDVGDIERPLVPGVDSFGLLDVYYKVLTRPEPAPAQHTIHRPDVDFTGCCRRVLEVLGGPGGTGNLRSILQSWDRAAERVVSFIAVLEMVRMQWLGLEQDGHLGEVTLVSRVDVDHDLEAIAGEIQESVEVG